MIKRWVFNHSKHHILPLIKSKSQGCLADSFWSGTLSFKTLCSYFVHLLNYTGSHSPVPSHLSLGSRSLSSLLCTGDNFKVIVSTVLIKNQTCGTPHTSRMSPLETSAYNLWHSEWQLERGRKKKPWLAGFSIKMSLRFTIKSKVMGCFFVCHSEVHRSCSLYGVQDPPEASRMHLPSPPEGGNTLAPYPWIQLFMGVLELVLFCTGFCTCTTNYKFKGERDLFIICLFV